MFPFRCVLCHSYQTLSGVCAACLADIKKLHITTACQWCSLPGVSPVCGACLKAPPSFDKVTAAFIYQQPLSRLIHVFKYGNGWQLAKAIAAVLPPPPAADIVISTPLHPNRERQRGFNQARELARRQRLSPADSLVRRVIDTIPQADMPSVVARRQNIRKAFVVTGKLSGESVLVVDDVMTSGATQNELAAVLKKAGAGRVEVYVIARVKTA